MGKQIAKSGNNNKQKNNGVKNGNKNIKKQQDNKKQVAKQGKVIQKKDQKQQNQKKGVQQQKDGQQKKNKKKQQIKKKKEVDPEIDIEGSETDESENLTELDEIEDENKDQVEKSDQIMEQFAYQRLVKQMETKKQKERKVMDFKFRNMELLDIFIKKSKNPELLLSSLVPYCQALKESQKDKQKGLFIDKLSKIIKKLFEKKITIAPEYRDTLDESIKQLFEILARVSKKHIQKTIQLALFSLIKLRSEIDKKDDKFKAFFLEQLKEAFSKSVTKKEVYYTEQMYKELFKAYPELCYPVLSQLLKYCNLVEFGGQKDHRRKQILEIVNYVLKLENFKSVSKEVEEETKNLVSGAFKNYQKIKIKKYSDLRKYIEIFVSIVEKMKKPEELREQIIDTVEAWEDDNNVTKLKEKLLSKLNKEEEE